MATLNYIDENGNINKVGIIPQNVIDKVIELDAKVNRGHTESVTASSDTWKSLVTKLKNKTDFTKITENAYIEIDRGSNSFIEKYALITGYHNKSEFHFTRAIAYSSSSAFKTIYLVNDNSNCGATECVFNPSPSINVLDNTSTTNGWKMTLYY